ncbi:MAG: hypothetical protein ACLTLQ_09620 [[Clostridium] scindens]
MNMTSASMEQATEFLIEHRSNADDAMMDAVERHVLSSKMHWAMRGMAGLPIQAGSPTPPCDACEGRCEERGDYVSHGDLCPMRTSSVQGVAAAFYRGRVQRP